MGAIGWTIVLVITHAAAFVAGALCFRNNKDKLANIEHDLRG